MPSGREKQRCAGRRRVSEAALVPTIEVIASATELDHGAMALLPLQPRPTVEPSAPTSARRGKKPTEYARDTSTRRKRLLKRTLGVVRKAMQLGKIVGCEMEFAFAVACRDPLRPEIGYNCFASSSDGDPRDALAAWTRRFEMEAERPRAARCFEVFGPSGDPDEIPPVLFSFPHRSVFPDARGRGFRDGDRADEELWETSDRRIGSGSPLSGPVASPPPPPPPPLPPPPPPVIQAPPDPALVPKVVIGGPCPDAEDSPVPTSEEEDKIWKGAPSRDRYFLVAALRDFRSV